MNINLISYNEKKMVQPRQPSINTSLIIIISIVFITLSFHLTTYRSILGKHMMSNCN